MTSPVTLTITAPTKRTDGTAVPVTELGPIKLETRNDAGTYVPLGNPIPPTQTTVKVTNVAVGKFWYRATFQDLVGGPDLQVETFIVVPASALTGGAITAALG